MSPAGFGCLLNQFLCSDTTTKEDLDALKRFLEDRPTRRPVTNYLTDIEVRLEIAAQLERMRREEQLRPFTAAFWSTLLVIPLDQLKEWVKPEFPFFSLYEIDVKLPLVLKLFLSKAISKDDMRAYPGLPDFQNRKRKSLDSESSLESRETSRNELQVVECRLRDKCCVVTKSPFFDVCHVFPFAAKNKPSVSHIIQSGLGPILGMERMQRVLQFLIKDDLLDTAQNMIALEPSLHRMWGNGMIALEPYQQLPDGVAVKFRYLRRRPANTLRWTPGTPMDLTTHPNTVLPSDLASPIPHFQTYRPVVDGEEVIIRSDNPALRLNWDVLQLQWDLCRIASLCAAADVPEDEDDSDDDDPSLGGDVIVGEMEEENDMEREVRLWLEESEIQSTPTLALTPAPSETLPPRPTIQRSEDASASSKAPSRAASPVKRAPGAENVRPRGF